MTYSTAETFDAFQQIVGKGIYLNKGTPKFKDRLSEQDIEAVKKYILSEAKNIRTAK